MSKAYLCDRCGELFPGDPKVTDANGKDFCPNCVRVIKIFGTIDPFFTREEAHEAMTKGVKNEQRND